MIKRQSMRTQLESSPIVYVDAGARGGLEGAVEYVEDTVAVGVGGRNVARLGALIDVDVEAVALGPVLRVAALEEPCGGAPVERGVSADGVDEAGLAARARTR